MLLKALRISIMVLQSLWFETLQKINFLALGFQSILKITCFKAGGMML